MLSILIPVYNVPIYQLLHELNEQINAISEEVELLVADDASTSHHVKNTNKQSCKALKHCRYLEQHTNRGRTATRQFLAKEARYDWFLFLDADVFPKQVDFLTRFIDQCANYDLLFGGIIYRENPPGPSRILRWTYGREREERSVTTRQTAPYQTILSGAFMIRKSYFFMANNQLENAYGLDALFTQNLKKIRARVHHIDNPVYHLGLEENKDFIQKTKHGLKTLVTLETEKKIDASTRPIQLAYHKVNRLGVSALFSRTIQLFNRPIERNLCSKKPSLFLFDLYKLGYYMKLKKKHK